MCIGEHVFLCACVPLAHRIEPGRWVHQAPPHSPAGHQSLFPLQSYRSGHPWTELEREYGQNGSHSVIQVYTFKHFLNCKWTPWGGGVIDIDINRCPDGAPHIYTHLARRWPFVVTSKGHLGGTSTSRKQCNLGSEQRTFPNNLAETGKNIGFYSCFF